MDNSQGSTFVERSQWTVFDRIATIVWNVAHMAICCVLAGFALQFLNVGFDPDLTCGNSNIEGCAESDTVDHTGDIARLLSIVALYNIALDLVGFLGLRFPILRNSTAMVILRSINIILWLAILTSGLFPSNVLIYIGSGTDSTTFLVGAVFVMEIITLIVLIADAYTNYNGDMDIATSVRNMVHHV